MTAPDPQTFDVVDAEAVDVETLFEIYLDVVAAGGANPAGGEAIRDVFVEGWIRRRRVYAARRDGVTVGGYFLRSNSPAMAGHIAQSGYLVAPSVSDCSAQHVSSASIGGVLCCGHERIASSRGGDLLAIHPDRSFSPDARRNRAARATRTAGHRRLRCVERHRTRRLAPPRRARGRGRRPRKRSPGA